MRFVANIVREAVESSGVRRVSDPLPFAIAAWSLVHGASTLLLEGKLDQHFGTSQAKRLKGAIAAVEAFGLLLRNKPSV